MVNANPWPKPIAVWGYDDTIPVACKNCESGLFEAETLCVMNADHSMGQVASWDANNLAYFGRKPIRAPLQQAPRLPQKKYNASATYVTLIIGDGDNIDYL